MRSILHLSDIHASCIPGRGTEARHLQRLYECITKDLTTQGVRPCEVLITGDLAYSGLSEDYAVLYERFLAPLLKAIELDERSVFICPGNHDLERAQWSDLHKLAVTTARQSSEASSKFISAAGEKGTIPWFTAFEQFRAQLDAKKQVLRFGPHFVYVHDSLQIISLNTALIADSDGVCGTLRLGSDAIEAISSSHDRRARLVIQHHPNSWLAEEERQALSTCMSRNNVKLQCYGHMHDHAVLTIRQFNDESMVRLQTGKLDALEKESRYTGYAVISLDERNDLTAGSISLRKFNHERGCFEPWTYLVDGGTVQFHTGASLPFNRLEYARVSQKIADLLQHDIISNIGVPSERRRRLTDVFIKPTLSLQSIKADSLVDPNPEKAIQFEDLLSRNEVVLISGNDHAGKTTVLRYLAIKQIEEQASGHSDVVCFYREFGPSERLKSASKVESAMLDLYLEQTSDKSIGQKLATKLAAGAALLLLDAVDHLDEKSLTTLLEFIKTTKCKAILSAGSRSILQIRDRLHAAGAANAQIIRIGGLDRAQIRSFVNAWQPSVTSDERAKIGRFVSNVFNTGLAHNPFVYSILLAIYEKKSVRRNEYLHEADIIENFLELLLQKHQQSIGEIPQYKDLLLLLGFIALQMAKDGCLEVSEDALFGLVSAFKKESYQDQFRTRDYVDLLVGSGVIKDGAKGYRFSQRCFFDYALALIATKNSDARDWLLCWERVSNFQRAIEYVAAIGKNDSGLIDLASTWCEQQKSELGRCGVSSVSRRAIDELTAAPKVDIQPLISIADQTSDLACEQNDADHNLDQIAPLSQEVDDDGELLDASCAPRSGYPIAISLFCRVVRASEHLLSRERTRELFLRALGFYDSFLAMALDEFYKRTLPRLAERITGELAKSGDGGHTRNLNERQIARFLEFFGTVIPNIVYSMQFDDLISQRSKPIINDVLDSVDPLQHISLVTTLCRLDDPNGVQRLAKIDLTEQYRLFMVVHELFRLVHFDGDISQGNRQELQAIFRRISKDRKLRTKLSDVVAGAKALGSGD